MRSFFCAYVFGLYFTGARLLVQKLSVERWWNWTQLLYCYGKTYTKKLERLQKIASMLANAFLKIWANILRILWRFKIINYLKYYGYMTRHRAPLPLICPLSISDPSPLDVTWQIIFDILKTNITNIGLKCLQQVFSKISLKFELNLKKQDI